MVKTKTAKQFDKAQLSSMREKYGASDFNAMIGNISETDAAASVAAAPSRPVLDTTPVRSLNSHTNAHMTATFLNC